MKAKLSDQAGLTTPSCVQADIDQPDGLLGCATAGAGDPRDAQSHSGTTSQTYASGHRRSDLRTHRSIATNEVCRDAKELDLGLIAVTDRDTIKVGGTAWHLSKPVPD